MNDLKLFFVLIQILHPGKFLTELVFMNFAVLGQQFTSINPKILLNLSKNFAKSGEEHLPAIQLRITKFSRIGSHHMVFEIKKVLNFKKYFIASYAV